MSHSATADAAIRVLKDLVEKLENEEIDVAHLIDGLGDPPPDPYVMPVRHKVEIQTFVPLKKKDC